MIPPDPHNPYSWLETIWSGLNSADDMSTELFDEVCSAMQWIEHKIMTYGLNRGSIGASGWVMRLFS